ncbi:MAG: hypothetical protein HN580_27365, partial [Deltaproteobacteria bacterium]|nr:hypothetical protein [Deltaproteobacteria bacterium]
MDVDFKLNIIGLGVKRVYWARLCRLLESLLNQDGIGLVFGYYNRKGLVGYRKYLEKRGQGEPDIIITSIDYFEDLDSLEQLIKENSALAKGGPPQVVFLEKDLNRFLTRLLKNQPAIRFSFKHLGELEIHDPNIFSFSDEEKLLLQINPRPELILSAQSRPALSGRGDVLFYPLRSIEDISWQQEVYTTDDFIKQQLEQLSIVSNRKLVKGVLKVGEKVYLSSGLQLSELNAITFNYLHIDHLISYRQIKKRSPNFEIFLQKFRELVKSRCCRIFGEHMREDTSAIKSFTPITVCSDFPVISDIFCQILIADGYRQVITTELAIDQTERLLLNLSDSGEDHNASLFSRDLVLETKIFDIPGFAKVTRKHSSQSPDGDVEIEGIRLKKSQLIKKLNKLGDQLKNLSGSKLLADQEKYMNMLASRKLEIVTVLLEMASIWDQKDEKQKRTYEENVLIFHEDQLQASSINNLLEGDGKRLFVDVTEKFSNLKTFVTVNTDILEPFLHEGFIFCYAASKSISVRKLQQFQNELSEKKYPDLVKGIENLKTEKSKLQSQLINLAYAEAWCMLKDSYQEQADLIFNSVRNAYQVIKRRRVSPDTIRSLCIFSSDAKRCQQVKNVLAHTFSHLKKSHFDEVLLPLNLATKVSDDEISGLKELSRNENIEEALIQEALTQNNVKRLSSYFKKALKELNLIRSDLLVIVQDLDLITFLVRMLRQSHESSLQIPILAVFSGPLQIEKMAELENQGVILVYHDPFFSK